MDIIGVATKLRAWKIELATKLRDHDGRATFDEILAFVESICPTQ